VRAVLNLGIGVTVGFSINITDTIGVEWGPHALANIKQPIISGCAKLPMISGTPQLLLSCMPQN
jgi:hypothetical protein